MALHTHLPIYKSGSDLLSIAYDIQEQMPRRFKQSLGAELHTLCVGMLLMMARANAARHARRAEHIENLLEQIHTATIVLRVAFEKRLVSPRLWSASTQLLDGIGKQAGGWLKSVSSNRAPAA